MTEACLEKYSGEGLYAMCFRMHYDSVDPDWCFACEVIVQTQTGCEETAQKGIEDGMGENFGRYCKYLPEEYKYAMDGLDGFRAVKEYLYENCLNLEECEELDDYDEREQMYEDIAKQSRDIRRSGSVRCGLKEGACSDRSWRQGVLCVSIYRRGRPSRKLCTACQKDEQGTGLERVSEVY